MTLIKQIMAAGLVVGLTFTAQPALAQDMDAALKALDDALPGSLIHNPMSLKWEASGNDIRTKIVDAPTLPSGQAIDVRIKKSQDKPWDSVLFVPISGDVEAGDTIQAYFWIRTVKPTPGSETAKVVFFLGRNQEPYDNIISEEIEPSSEWKLMNLTGVAGRDFRNGKLKAEYQLGKSKQRVEVGPVYVSRLDE